MTFFILMFVDEYEISQNTKLTATSPSIDMVARVGVCKVLETDLWGGANCVAVFSGSQ